MAVVWHGICDIHSVTNKDRDMEKIAILKTNRSEYSIKEAANDSITVRELIEYLQYNLDPDSRIVFSNDNGYTYGYITERVVDEETWEA